MRNAMLLFPAVAGLVSGQTPQAEAERRQAILDYQLNMKRANQLLTALSAMTKYEVSLPDFQERVRKSMTMTPAEQIAQIEKDPKASSVLKENGPTAREYIIGVPALRMAVLRAQGMPPGSKIVASPANVAFAKANLAELKSKIEAADGMRSGKLALHGDRSGRAAYVNKETQVRSQKSA
jgi:hypothetical protein